MFFLLNRSRDSRPFILELQCHTNVLHHITSAIKNIDNNFSFDCKTFILGSVGNQSEKYNVLCLEIKRFIYNCRCRIVTPTIHGL